METNEILKVILDKVETMDKRFDNIDKRFDNVDKRLTNLEEDMTVVKVNTKLALQGQRGLSNQMNDRFRELNNRIDEEKANSGIDHYRRN